MRKRMRLKTRVISNNATKRFVRFSKVKYGFSSIPLVVAQDTSIGRTRPIEEPLYSSLARPDAGRIGDELLEGVSDQRYFNPSGVSIARRVLVTPQGHRSTSGQSVVPRGRRYEFLGFDVPSSVLVCVRRKQRRQVLFAKGKNGRGNRRPRWNATSHIWC